jgi:2'-5' RNA ligase
MRLSKRLFVGLELPSEIKAVLIELDPGLRGLRWLPDAQIHLTLSFLGEVEHFKTDVLFEVLRQVHVPPFFLPLQGVGTFSAKGRPSVVWVGVGKGHPHLFALHKHVQDAVLHAGLEADLRPFHPHVTVARGTGISSQALQPFLRTNRETDVGLIKVSEFALFSSILNPEGAIYEVELRVPL